MKKKLRFQKDEAIEVMTLIRFMRKNGVSLEDISKNLNVPLGAVRMACGETYEPRPEPTEEPKGSVSEKPKSKPIEEPEKSELAEELRWVLLCPRCGSDKIQKRGLRLSGEQEYACRKCKRRFVEQKQRLKMVMKEPVKGIVCPRCGSDKLQRRGTKTTGEQVYACKNCSRRFVMMGKPKMGRPTIMEKEIEKFIRETPDTPARKLTEMIEKELGKKISPSIIFRYKKKHNIGERRIPIKDIICPRCYSVRIVRRGVRPAIGGRMKQRYACKNCDQRFVLGDERIKKDDKLVALVRGLHDGGKSLREIRDIIEEKHGRRVHHATIYRWITGKKASELTRYQKSAISRGHRLTGIPSPKIIGVNEYQRRRHRLRSKDKGYRERANRVAAEWRKNNREKLNAYFRERNRKLRAKGFARLSRFKKSVICPKCSNVFQSGRKSSSDNYVKCPECRLGRPANEFRVVYIDRFKNLEWRRRTER